MMTQFAPGQRVRFNQRCVLTSNVPKNSRGYQYMALRSQDGDDYTGAGVIEAGTACTVMGYASHGTGSTDNPIVEVAGKLACVHTSNLDDA